MAASIVKIAVLASVLGLVTSVFDGEICTFVKETYGLLPPALPTSFVAKGEYVDHVRQEATYTEMAFDWRQGRAKLLTLHRGVERHRIFDYDVEQVVEYYRLHPGVKVSSDVLSHTCAATFMDDSDARFVFGLVDEETSRPKMFTSSQVLRYGGQYRYAYNGTDRDFLPERGLVADKYIGCLYDTDLDATINATYLFANAKVVTSGGTYDSVVTGVEGRGLLSTPLRADLFGAIADEAGDPHLFNTTLSWAYFQGDPLFPADTFRIPPYMHCKNFLGRHDMPKLPDAFSTRIQSTSFERDILGNLVAPKQTAFEQVFYYKEKLLARRDYEPNEVDTDIFSKFQSYDPVKTVYDFNQGAVFVSSERTGRCFSRAIAQGDYFDANQNAMFVQLADPEEVFRMHTDDMEYKGTDFARDIECDVWSSRYFDKEYNATYVKETYTSTNGWHNDVDQLQEYGVPVKHTIIKEELGGELVEGVSTYNFLKFKNSPPALFRFDVGACIDTIPHRDFALKLDVLEETRDLIYKYQANFLETAQYYIAQVSQMLSPLRVQRLRLHRNTVGGTQDFLLVTLLGKPDLRAKIPVGQRGPSLDQAVANLHNIVETQQFNMRFYFKGTKDEMEIVAVPRGNLYVRSESGNLSYVPYPVPRSTSTVQQDEEHEILEWEKNQVLHADDESDEKGMTSGNLTLLAFGMLFIGVGIGIALMYLYIRQFSERGIEVRIDMKTQRSVDAEAGPSSADNRQ